MKLTHIFSIFLVDETIMSTRVVCSPSFFLYYSFSFFFFPLFPDDCWKGRGVSSNRRDRCRSFLDLFPRFGPFFGSRVAIGHLHVFLWIKHKKKGERRERRTGNEVADFQIILALETSINPSTVSNFVDQNEIALKWIVKLFT